MPVFLHRGEFLNNFTDETFFDARLKKGGALWCLHNQMEDRHDRVYFFGVDWDEAFLFRGKKLYI